MVSRDGLNDVASSIPYFSSVSTYWHVFYCQLTEVLRMLAKADQVFSESIPAISSGKHNWMLCGFHFKVRVLLLVYKQQACCAVRRYNIIYWGCQKSFCIYTAFVRNIPQTELLRVFSNRSSMYVHLYKHIGDHFSHLLQLE